MTNYDEVELRCVEHLNMDYMPLNDIVREFSGYTATPSRNEFMASMEFLKYLIKKYKIAILEGPSMKPIKRSPESTINWLKENWKSGNYDEMSYSVWFKIEE